MPRYNSKPEQMGNYARSRNLIEGGNGINSALGANARQDNYRITANTRLSQRQKEQVNKRKESFKGSSPTAHK